MDSVAIVFDLDGTIWDSWPWYARVIANIAKSDETQLRDAIFDGGNVVALCKNYNVTRSKFISECRRCIDDLEVYSEVDETLSELKRRNIPLGIFTSLPLWIAGPILSEKKLRNYFDSVIAASWGRPAKPNPVGLKKALNELNLSVHSRGIYVGDTQIDSLTAENAGVRFVWVEFGYAISAPEYRFTSLKKFADILEVQMTVPDFK